MRTVPGHAELFSAHAEVIPAKNALLCRVQALLRACGGNSQSLPGPDLPVPSSPRMRR